MDRLDILNRTEFVQKLINLTESIAANKANVSFAMNGTWGCGKSFVLDMFEEQLSQIQSEEYAAEKYFIIRYNCWKYDYYEEPLIALVAAIITAIEEKTNLFLDSKARAKLLGALKLIGVSILSMANNVAKEKTGINVKKYLK